MNYTQCGSALALPYADGIAQTCVTSPPYYGLRDYGTARWEGGDANCSHEMRPDGGPKQLTSAGAAGHVHRNCKCGARRIDSQIGLEQTPAAYVAQIVAAMREVWRVLRDDGTLWLNLGDSYAAQRGGTSMPAQTVAGGVGGKGDEAAHRGMSNGYSNHRNAAAIGYKHKDLMGIPWRVAFALQDAGWYLRSDIIWAKPNPMPESVSDRTTKSHEYVFMLAKQPRYFYDAEAIKEKSEGVSGGPFSQATHSARRGAQSGGNETGRPEDNGTRNARSVWNIATTPYGGAHFATMPPELARRCILAGSSARGQCPKCGAPWVRRVERRLENTEGWGKASKDHHANTQGSDAIARNGQGRAGDSVSTTTGWAASCECQAGDPVPQIVLDPFAGSGTTAMCALQAGRRAIGTELNPKYLRLQDDRTQVTIGLGMVLA